MGGKPQRYLGLAFASADLLFEIEPHGAIAFAMGAAEEACGRSDQDLVGRSCSTLFETDDAALVEALVAGLEPGRRKGPIAVRLAQGKKGLTASLSACRLPQLEPNISLALSLNGATAVLPNRATGAGGLYDAAALEAASRPFVELARATGAQLDLALVELGGLDAAIGALPEDEAERLRRLTVAAVRAESWGAAAAARLGSEQFAVLRQAGEPAERLAARLARVLSVAAGKLTPTVKTCDIDTEADGGAQAARLIRHAMDAFLSERTAGETPARSLGRSVQATLAQAGAFGALVAEKRFKLVFQPVVDLATRETSHYETLVRFDEKHSPFAIIRLAEELDLIEKLDIAVAEQSVRRLQADETGRLRLAVNVSGRTIISERYVRAIAALAGSPLKGRLLFEITESAKIDDLDKAGRHIAFLRSRGYPVSLDDFGAGAASFDYLRRLSVDFVKIDGRYVRDLVESGRNQAVVRHVVELCRELKVKTVAEMVESAAIEAALKDCGVDYGQGWLYGQPEELPVAAAPQPARRRTGTSDEWR